VSYEVNPVGTTCQLACSYCYEQTDRDAHPVQRYHREAFLAAVDKITDYWSLFGGEALILPLPQLEELLKKGFDKNKRTGVQTNAALITDAHIDLFIKYKTSVGISLDGPAELNDSRWAGTLDATRKATACTHWAIKRLVERSQEHPHLMPNLIVTMHAGNAAKDRFPKFMQWFRDLDAMGIPRVNIHVMELDSKAEALYLPQDELVDRLLDLWNLQDELKTLHFSKFQEVLKLMQGDDSVTCTWKPCDPINTDAVQSIDHKGQPSICVRTFKDGKTWLPAEGTGQAAPFVGHQATRMYVRQLVLYVTPQEHNGCQGCEYWMGCFGNCPGEGERGDWRNRSHYCHTYKRLFAEAAKRLRAVGIKPICDWENRKDLEARLYQLWSQGTTSTLKTVIEEAKNQKKGWVLMPDGSWHGDHTDVR
jgi:uncharacterized protein